MIGLRKEKTENEIQIEIYEELYKQIDDIRLDENGLKGNDLKMIFLDSMPYNGTIRKSIVPSSGNSYTPTPPNKPRPSIPNFKPPQSYDNLSKVREELLRNQQEEKNQTNQVKYLSNYFNSLFLYSITMKSFLSNFI